MIGPRLKLARAAAGLSLRALADRVGRLVTAQAIGKYERDEMMPSSSVLIALARTLGVTEEHLLNSAAVELAGVEFRKRKLTSARDVAAVRARILSEVERYLEIERILHLESHEADLPRRRPIQDMGGAERAARALREHWQLGDDAVPNLCELLEEKGIKICAIDLPAKVSGVQALVRTTADQALPVIVVNAADAGERQRFTLAHELGHLWLSVQKDLDAEKACMWFAGAFLVPEGVLRREVGQHRRSVAPRELFELKRLFGVSAQAIAYRCRDLGIIGASAFAEICRTFNARGWRAREPLPLQKERPQRFERLCLRALAEDLISESKASELLGKTVEEVGDLPDLLPDDVGAPDPRAHPR